MNRRAKKKQRATLARQIDDGIHGIVKPFQFNPVYVFILPPTHVVIVKALWGMIIWVILKEERPKKKGGYPFNQVILKDLGELSGHYDKMNRYVSVKVGKIP